MPFLQHLRITASGTLGGVPGSGEAPEAFSYGLNIGGEGTNLIPDDAANAAQMEDIADDIAAFHARPTSVIGSAARLTMVKIALIGSDGKYVTGPYIAERDVPGGAASAVAYPPQISLCVSLGSNRRGPSGRGRFYLPLPTVTLNPQTLLAPDDLQANVGVSVVTLIEALNNQPGFDVTGERVTIASSKGLLSPVTEVRVGRAFDTIRTRRRSLAESYGPPLSVS